MNRGKLNQHPGTVAILFDYALVLPDGAQGDFHFQWACVWACVCSGSPDSFCCSTGIIPVCILLNTISHFSPLEKRTFLKSCAVGRKDACHFQAHRKTPLFGGIYIFISRHIDYHWLPGERVTGIIWSKTGNTIRNGAMSASRYRRNFHA